MLNNNLKFFIKNILNLDLENDFIFIKDSNLNYIYANSKFCSLFNITIESIIGKNDDSFIKDPILCAGCQESDIYALQNNHFICFEEAFGKTFRVLKLKINLEKDTEGILCFAKLK